MRMIDIIEKKRDGKSLTREEIEFFVNGYTRGEVPDYQASSLAMARRENRLKRYQWYKGRQAFYRGRR